MRLACCSRVCVVRCFNSRTPGGVRHIIPPPNNILLKFQFTHPGRGATKYHHHRERGYSEFQFTHPGRGATLLVSLICLFSTVSIHAPREGCDTYRATACQRTACFNSRTPGGVRPTLRTTIILIDRFQFTHPGRGATRNISVITAERRVSIHAPREGCDRSNGLTLGGL